MGSKFEDIIWNMDEEDELGQSVKNAQQAAYARCREVLRAAK
ncbi:MAG TPA: hypothetical protein VKB51_01920 [bacterium]|nr:hypothetical protein [bacterium]